MVMDRTIDSLIKMIQYDEVRQFLSYKLREAVRFEIQQELLTWETQNIIYQ